KSVLVYTLKCILKMLHPFMPFVTEEIYTKLPNSERSIMLSKYPEYDSSLVFKESKNIDDLILLITKIRNFKQENHLKNIYLKYDNKFLSDNDDVLTKLLKLENTNNYQGMDEIDINFKDSTVKVYYDNSANKTAEIENLYRDKERLESSILRREKLLSNENYVSKAPKNIVDTEKSNLEKEKQELETVLTKLENID
ncbi:MAG: class I tRNA ligase family protein, partial [Bacilli bacterium]|nr:class I tRNA ligase family protein [Bacilli bacterium]